jgi:hypothetical protein
MQRLIAITPVLLLFTVSITRADVPTPSDLQQLFKQGDYDGVVKGCTEALAPGGVTEPDDRFKVYWLKGEALLKLRQADAAVDAFNGAEKETQDDRKEDSAKATVILIGRSKDLVYTSQSFKPPASPVPRPDAPKPAVNLSMETTPTTHPALRAKPVILPPGQYDIADPVHRTSAMLAMWKDERTDAEKTIKEQIALKTLPAIDDALTRIKQSEPIAITAGSTEWAQSQKNLLSNAARVDANTAMLDMRTQLVAITKDQAKRHNNQQKPKAMPQSQRDQLNKMTESLNQMVEALKALPESLGVAKDTFQPQLDRAAELQDKATTVLAAN